MLLSESSSLLLKRGVRRGFLTLVREREYGTTLGALLGVVLLAQVLLLLTFGIEGVHRLLQSQLDLRLQVQEDADHQDVQNFLAEVGQLPMVRDTSFVTREQAYERERVRNPELISFLEEFNVGNPFPDTVAVTLRSLEDYDDFAAFIRQSEWTSVVDPTFLSQATSQEQEVQQMLRFTSAGRTLVYTILVLLLGVLLFVVIELTRRRALLRREEIFVERMVGAPTLAVLVPFATEATILLLIALLLSTLILWAFVPLLPIIIPALGAGGTFHALQAESSHLLWRTMPWLFVLELILVPLVSIAGAGLGMRPQLKRGGMMLA